MAWRPFMAEYTIDDPKADIKAGERIEQYKLGEKAVYFPRENYLPYEAIKAIWIQPHQLNVIGCCGKGLPVSMVRLDTGTKDVANLMVEKKTNARKMVEMILAKNPSIEYVEYERGYQPIAYRQEAANA
ncbi:MAG: hypothetical protein J5935_01340 [Lachnospiraceae bacterium]|nr:hypothetical protein [Lachnospiraceae bacterium]